MRKNRFAAFGGGAIIGTLGGLIGLGGAEFRLPLLIGMFGFASLEAVILNKAMSIVVVASALPFRAGTIPFSVLMDHWGVILNLLAGSLLGAWVGAGWAIRLRTETLYQVIAVLLLFIALLLVFGHNPANPGIPPSCRCNSGRRRSGGGFRHRCSGLAAGRGGWGIADSHAGIAVWHRHQAGR